MLVGEEVAEAEVEVGSGVGGVVIVGGEWDVGDELAGVCS